MTSDGWRTALGEPGTFAGNQPTLLDGPARAYVVDAGSVALFSVPIRDGRAAGTRRAWKRIGAGGVLFETPVRALHSLRLGFVPIQEARIQEVPLADLWRHLEPHGARIQALVTHWIDSLSHALPSGGEPRLATRVATAGDVHLARDQVVRAERGQCLFARVVDGTVSVRGNPESTLSAQDDWFPVEGELWLRASRTTEVRFATLADTDVTTVAAALANLQDFVLRAILSRQQREAETELERLQQGRHAEALRIARGVSELAEVLDPQPAEEHVADPTVTAMQAIGRQLGVEIETAAFDATDPQAIETVARTSRLRTRSVRLSGAWWKSDSGPLLGFRGDDARPVAIFRQGGRYRFLDPAAGTEGPVDADLAASLAPHAWTFYRPLPDGPLKVRDLFRFALARRRREMALAAGTGAVATLLGMITPQATALLMDQAIPDADRRLLLEIGAGLLAAAFGQVLFHLSQGIVLVRLGMLSEAETQAALWDRLLRLPPSFFRRFSSGDLQSRVMAVSEIAQQVSGITLASLFAGFLALLNLGLLYYYSPGLTAIAATIGLVALVFTATIGVFVRRNLRQLLELDGKLFGHVVQILSGIAKLRVSGSGDRAYAQWLGKYAGTLRLWADSYRLQDRVFLFNVVLPSVAAVSLFLGAHALMGNPGSELSLGVFLAFHAAFGAFLGGVVSLSNTLVSMLDIVAKGQRIAPILEADPEIDQRRNDPGKLSGRFAMRDIQFGYRADGPTVLKGIEFKAEPGEFVALVGASGCGKSTVLRLLLGFEQPSAGSVTYDGQDLAGLDVVAVRRQIGVVLQGGKLDAGSIFDNIACGSVITLDDAWAAAEDAGIADEVRAMPMGMHTIVSVAGGNLSGGQRQRLLIARALAQRPCILLFDEATSALDNRTQAIVSQSLERLNVTRVVVAHRLSTIRNADRIYVLEDGRVAQHGRFDELMKRPDGAFSRMMKRQLA